MDKFQMSKLSTNIPSTNFLTLPLPSFSCLVYKYCKISQRRRPSRYKHFLNEINHYEIIIPIKMKMKKLLSDKAALLIMVKLKKTEISHDV